MIESKFVQPKSRPQEQLKAAIQSDDQLVLVRGPAGCGKAQPLDARVLLANGRWTTMGQLEVGTEIAGRDRPQTVTGVFDQGQRQVYKVTTTDGRSTEACAEHLWATYRATEGWTTRRTDQLLGQPTYLPSFEGVEDRGQPSSEDPYLVAWCVATRRRRWLGRVQPSRLPRWILEDYPNQGLRGFLDGAAVVRPRRGIELWKQTREPSEARHRVLELIRRCGGSASGGGANWNVRLPRPNEYVSSFAKRRVLANLNGHPEIKVKSVVPTRVTATRCISVDNEDRLYVTDDYIVTHNTYVSVAEGLNGVAEQRWSSVVFTRPNEPMGRSLGSFPGEPEDKLAHWLAPMLSVVTERYEGQQLSRLRKLTHLQPMETVRGQSWTNAIVFCDEAQNLSMKELKTLTTRVGEGSKLVLMGDPTQKDIRQDSLDKFADFLSDEEGISVVNFTLADSVRSPLVKRLLELYQRLPD